ncbi:unnamed protein product [Symbiodinium sp. CCMP2592]|nr:unnamed protein product [Symbiodinium sp. CCMP2592]
MPFPCSPSLGTGPSSKHSVAPPARIPRVADLLAIPQLHSLQELLDPLHCIEFFAGQSGSAKIAKCFKRLGRRVQAFDLSRSETHNMDSTEGFLAGLLSILRLRPGSFVHFGTVCTSFTWINAGTHGRRLWQPLGNQHLDYVALGSRLVERTVLLALLAWHMGAVFSIENPLGSMIAEQPIFQIMIQYFKEKSGGWMLHSFLLLLCL